MSTAPSTSDPQTVPGGPVWDIARLYPNQGHWSEADYFALSDRNWLIEYSHGRVEFLPMPTISHQRMVLFLYRAFLAYLTALDLGEVLVAPFRVRLDNRTYREPGLGVMLREHADRVSNPFWTGADLVVEILSPDNRDHDLVTKRREYATAGIPEYWIVDPEQETMIVLTLDGETLTYTEHGLYARGERAASRLLEGFGVDVNGLFDVKV
jgi:Uma2 family endonuclease